MKVKWSPQAADAVLRDRKRPYAAGGAGSPLMVQYRECTADEKIDLWTWLTEGYEL